jgi:ankyrin repeat protein
VGIFYLGHKNIVEYLLSCGTNVDAVDEHAISSLSWISERNHIDIVASLLKAGASPILFDKSNRTPLIWTSRRATYGQINIHNNRGIFLLGHTEIVDLLIKHNASVNNIGKKNMTALLAATKGRHIETAIRLLENCTIDIKVQDKVC